MSYSSFLQEAQSVMESMVGLQFEEVARRVTEYSEEHGCVEVYRDSEMQYSQVSFSVSDYGFCADFYTFDFDESGVCVSVEFVPFEEDDDYEL